ASIAPARLSAMLAVAPSSRSSEAFSAATVGGALKASLERELGGLPGFVEIRGQGLILGIQLDRPCNELLARAAAEKQLLISVTADSVIRLLPALILSAAEADDIVGRLVPLVRSFLGAQP
ncbi:MAG: aminotransferase class III-fold pyridoxal phosphate-dependent enzyme, partial [Rhizobacter sp.]